MVTSECNIGITEIAVIKTTSLNLNVCVYMEALAKRSL